MSYRYISLALCTAYDPDAEILPGVVDAVHDVWPVPQWYDARLDALHGDYSEHNWAEVDVQIAPGVSADAAAAYLRRVAAWLDEHGAELLAHPRVVEELGAPRPIDPRRVPRLHLHARDNLRVAVERGLPKRKP